MEREPRITNRRIPAGLGLILNDDADLWYVVVKFIIPGSLLFCSSFALPSIIVEFKFVPLKTGCE